MSKSKGNVVYPEMLIDRYGLDATRYFLLREMPVSQDEVFTPKNFVERFNVDLCNDLGNLLNRTISMVNKYFEGIIPKYNGHKNDVDEEFENYTIEKIKSVQNNIENMQISIALSDIFNIVSRTNKYIDETMPWIQAKEENKEKLESTVYHLVENLRKIAILLTPFMDETSKNIFRQLGVNEGELKTWESLESMELINSGAKVIKKGEPLFMRLDESQEIEWIKEKMSAKD